MRTRQTAQRTIRSLTCGWFQYLAWTCGKSRAAGRMVTGYPVMTDDFYAAAVGAVSLTGSLTVRSPKSATRSRRPPKAST